VRRLTLVLLAVLMAALAPVSAATARGDGWTFLEAGDFSARACGTRIREMVVTNREYAKFAVDADGVLHFVLVTGTLKIRVTNVATGSSVLVNASGTGHDAIAYPNGDFLYTSAGRSLILLTEKQAEETGLPTLFSASGNMVILFGGDGSASVQSQTGQVTDLCGVLT
jgi:hypothetical protein